MFFLVHQIYKTSSLLLFKLQHFSIQQSTDRFCISLLNPLPKTGLLPKILPVTMFDLKLPLRGLQFLFAIISLGLNGYGA